MEIKNCTDIEQSKKLIELGIDVNTADMWYVPVKHEEETLYELVTSASLTRGIIPAWSVSALVNLIPSVNILHVDDVYYCVTNFTDGTSFRTKQYNNLVDAAFEMVCWLNYKGNEKKE